MVFYLFYRLEKKLVVIFPFQPNELGACNVSCSTGIMLFSISSFESLSWELIFQGWSVICHNKKYSLELIIYNSILLTHNCLLRLDILASIHMFLNERQKKKTHTHRTIICKSKSNSIKSKRIIVIFLLWIRMMFYVI